MFLDGNVYIILFWDFFEKSNFDNQMCIYNGKNLKNKAVFVCAKVTPWLSFGFLWFQIAFGEGAVNK